MDIDFVKLYMKTPPKFVYFLYSREVRGGGIYGFKERKGGGNPLYLWRGEGRVDRFSLPSPLIRLTW